MLPRGIRNHNPLNIRRTSKDQWKGLSKAQTDRAFVQFETLEWGWPSRPRAAWASGPSRKKAGIHTDASLFVFLPKCCCYFGISITILQPS